MYLVDKKHVVLFERGKDAGKIAGFIEHRTGCDFKSYAKLVCHNSGKGCLAQARRAEEQRMVECLGAHARGLHEHAQILDYLFLPVERFKTSRTQGFFYIAVAGHSRGGIAYVEIVG